MAWVDRRSEGAQWLIPKPSEVLATNNLVLAAADGITALKFFQADPHAIDLLVTDIAMNPINGRDLAIELVRLNPSLRVVFVSGYVGAEVLQYQGESPFDFEFVQKPFLAEDLLSKIGSKSQRVLAAGGQYQI